MFNFKLLIEYKGTGYSGWQRQRRQKTVQGEIEKALKKIFGRQINLIGSGRTDTGVHALGQVANFSLETGLPKTKIQKALNFYLPNDIRIKKIDFAKIHFHSRFAAKSRIYRYTIIQEYSPFLKDEAYYYPGKLDLERMKKAAIFLLGRHDFSSFQNRGSRRKHAIINLQGLKIKKGYFNPGRCKAIMIEVEANAFLYRLVRNLVGLLLEVGRGKIKPEAAKYILKKKDRCHSPSPAPAHGLYLLKVKY